MVRIANDDQTGGEFNGLNRREADAQFRAEKAYLDEVIEKHQQSIQPEASASPRTHVDTLLYPEIKEENDGTVISIHLSNNTSRIYPIQPLIAFCETATRMVTWRKVDVVDKSINTTAGKSDFIANSASQALEKENFPVIELSLVEFDADATISFLEVLISLYFHERTLPKPRDKGEVDALSKQHLLTLIDNGMVSEIHIV